jgi:hypothetical protein
MSPCAGHHAGVTTPTTEPAVLFTGDTWAWTRALADYPATASWVLKYVLINSAARINITSAASGDLHAVSVAAATTAGYTAGAYTWQAYVELGLERHTVGQGSVQVRAGYSSGSGGADARTQAEIALQEAIDALATYTASRGMVNDYTIGGRSMRFRSIDEIRALIAFWRGEVAREADPNNLLPGSGKKILTRFG